MRTKEGFQYRKACLPCKKRKSKCGKIKPCPSCVCHETEAECYPQNERDHRKAGSELCRLAPAPFNKLSSVETCLFSLPLLDEEEDVGEGQSTTSRDKITLYPKQCFQEVGKGDQPAFVPFPDADECELAFYCYITEIQFHYISVNRRMRQAFRRFTSTGKATLLEQAFICAILAIVGNIASGTQICPRARTIRQPERQTQLIKAVSLILDYKDLHASNRQDQKLDDDASDHLLRAQIECLIAFNLESDFASAYQKMKFSGQYARQAGLFDFDTIEFQAMDKELKEDIFRFRAEMFTPFFYFCHVSGLPLPDERELPLEYVAIDDDDPCSAELLQGKLAAIHFALRIQVLLKELDKLTTPPPDKLLNEIILQDYQLESFMESSTVVAFVDHFNQNYISDSITYQKLMTACGIHQFVLALRIKLLQSAARSEILASAIQVQLLHSASASLQILHKVLVVRRSVWRRIGFASITPAPIEMAMSIFATAIEQSGAMSPPLGTFLQEGKSSPASPLATFVSNFDSIYDLVNTLGILGSSSLQCAQMLKQVPIDRPVPLHNQIILHDKAVEYTRQQQQHQQQEAPQSSEANIPFNEEAEMDALTFSSMLYNWLNGPLEAGQAEKLIQTLDTL